MSPEPPPHPPVQIVYKPGGLSSAAHAVHILICFMTCGLWIPGYILFMLGAAGTRTEVIVPVGAQPSGQVIPPPSPEAYRREKAKQWWIVGTVFGLILLCVVATVFAPERPAEVAPTPTPSTVRS